MAKSELSGNRLRREKKAIRDLLAVDDVANYPKETMRSLKSKRRRRKGTHVKCN